MSYATLYILLSVCFLLCRPKEVPRSVSEMRKPGKQPSKQVPLQSECTFWVEGGRGGLIEVGGWRGRGMEGRRE